MKSPFWQRLLAAFRNEWYCAHNWQRESSLTVCRVERDADSNVKFVPDHIRYYCPKCHATKRGRIPAQ